MDQKVIIEGLKAALTQGSGDLDALEKLLDRAKQDIATVRKEEADRAEREKQEQLRKGQKVAEIANRVLEDKTTEADVIYVMESYLRSEGWDNVLQEATEWLNRLPNREDKSKKNKINECLTILDELINEITTNNVVKPNANANAAVDADAAIDSFLRKMGVR